jgi:hypothetical protein
MITNNIPLQMIGGLILGTMIAKFGWGFFQEFIKFLYFIHEHNPTLINYYDYDEADSCKTELEPAKENIIEPVKPELFETKYLDRFKRFSNEYFFTEQELEEEQNVYERLKLDFETDRRNKLHEIEQKLNKINDIKKHGNINLVEPHATNINEYGKAELRNRYDTSDPWNSDSDNDNDDDVDVRPFDYEEWCRDLLKEELELTKLGGYLMFDLKIDETELKAKAREEIINKKLDMFINNYVSDHTPLGNIFMRYNNDKKSFEYFSNSTIPYRYLEPVARKYVMTYWCKPIFVDMEEELKKSETNPEMNKTKAQIKMKQLASLNATHIIKSKDSKQRNNGNIIKTQTQTQMKAKLVETNNSNSNNNSNNESHLLKERANRYTWEGRLTQFNPLKKVPRKLFEKRLNMSYAEFKQMQQNKKSQ